MPTVDVQKLTRFLNLSERRIGQLVREGMPKEARGQYDPIKCAVWYIRYLQAAIERRTTPIEAGAAGEREARVRLLRSQADLKEMELARERSQLVAVEDVERLYSDLRRVTTARILAIPPQLAPELVGETQRTLVQAKIEKAIKHALSDLAKTRFDAAKDEANTAKS